MIWLTSLYSPRLSRLGGSGNVAFTSLHHYFVCYVSGLPRGTLLRLVFPPRLYVLTLSYGRNWFYFKGNPATCPCACHFIDRPSANGDFCHSLSSNHHSLIKVETDIPRSQTAVSLSASKQTVLPPFFFKYQKSSFIH